ASESRLKFTQRGQEGTGSTYFNKKKQEDRQTVMNRFFQRKRYKEAYQSARSGATSGKAGASKAAATAETMTTKAKNALKEVARRNHAVFRSEEHTSELQSRFDLVCRLLLEKKKE